MVCSEETRLSEPDPISGGYQQREATPESLFTDRFSFYGIPPLSLYIVFCHPNSFEEITRPLSITKLASPERR